MNVIYWYLLPVFGAIKNVGRQYMTEDETYWLDQGLMIRRAERFWVSKLYT